VAGQCPLGGCSRVMARFGSNCARSNEPLNPLRFFEGSDLHYDCNWAARARGGELLATREATFFCSGRALRGAGVADSTNLYDV
jgi:hypothetical protein